VSRRTRLADEVILLELRDPTGRDLPQWTPGAHIDVQLGPNTIRQYSLCGDPHDRSVWAVAIRRLLHGRGGSQRAHDTLFEGLLVDVRGPRNHFVLDGSPRYIFIAAGIGITPIIAMAREAHTHGADWRLAYAGRGLSTMAFTDELARLGGDRVSLHPSDQRRRLDLRALLGTPQDDALVYCCGPESLLVEAEKFCARWPAGALHVERFAPKPIASPPQQGVFDVALARSGMVLAVPEDRSILEVLEDARVPVASSCRQGICGTCETAIVTGAVDHRDALLTPAEQDSNETMMICVSRAACPRLVLDL
jgi:ferredoxin-NADP reductase